jgi:hypothetical protein
MTVNNERRQHLIAKYGIDLPPDPNTLVANAALAAPTLLGIMMNWQCGADGPGINQLFDPEQCPKLHEVASAALRDVRMAIARRDVQMQDDLGDPMDANDDDTAVFVYFVGAPEVHVVRPRDFEVFALEVYRHKHLPMIKRARASSCRVRLAPACEAVNGWRIVEYWPWLCGRWLLLFPVCPACRDRAIETASDGVAFGVIRENERAAEAALPRWARTAPWYLRAWTAIRRAFSCAR